MSLREFADTDSCLLATGRVQRGRCFFVFVLWRSKVAQILDRTLRCCACGTDGRGKWWSNNGSMHTGHTDSIDTTNVQGEAVCGGFESS